MLAYELKNVGEMGIVTDKLSPCPESQCETVTVKELLSFISNIAFIIGSDDPDKAIVCSDFRLVVNFLRINSKDDAIIYNETFNSSPFIKKGC